MNVTNLALHCVRTGALALAAGVLTSPILADGPDAHTMMKPKLQERVAAAQTVSFDVYLPLEHREALDKLLVEQQTTGSANFQKWLTPQQFHEQFGVDPAKLEAIQRDLTAHGLAVEQVAPRRLHVTGTAGAVEQTFTTTLHRSLMPDGKAHVAAATALSLPASLVRSHAAVLGLNGTERMHKYSHAAAPQNRYTTAGPYWFTDLKQAYDWPSYQSLNGKGVTIGILMTGGYQYSDMSLYFGHEKLATPIILETDILGGAPFDPIASGETHLDLQQSGGMAPKAVLELYNLPDLMDSSIVAGLTQIVEDNKTDVVSMSFGGPEIFYTPAYNDGVDFTGTLRQEDDLFAQGNAQGITFVASSGDAGALAAPPLLCFTEVDPTAPCGSFQPSAEFPASSPHVTGVGGTNLATTHSATNLDSNYVYEQAYGDPLTADIFYGTAATGGYWGSGGGDSILFRQPAFQQLVDTGNKRFRTVPDVSLHMGGCPANAICNPDDSADLEAIGGHYTGVIGTSASAPDFAGLTALNIQRFGTRLGNQNFYLYALAAAQNAGLVSNIYHTGIPGFNGLYTSGNKGYNRVLGNGTVYGKELLLAPLLPAAGTPQTPSNP